MTFTVVKVRSTSFAPHAGQAGRAPSAYAAMDMRTSKLAPQRWHWYSYAGIRHPRLDLGMYSRAPGGGATMAS